MRNFDATAPSGGGGGRPMGQYNETLSPNLSAPPTHGSNPSQFTVAPFDIFRQIYGEPPPSQAPQFETPNQNPVDNFVPMTGPGGGNVTADQLANPPYYGGVTPDQLTNPPSNLGDFNFAGGNEPVHFINSPDGSAVWAYDENWNWVGETPLSPSGGDQYADNSGYPAPPGVEPDALPGNPNLYPGGTTIATGEEPMLDANGNPIPGTGLSPQDQANAYNYGPQGQFPQNILDELRQPTDWKGFVDTAKRLGISISDALKATGRTIADAAGGLVDNIVNDPGYSSPSYLRSIGYNEGQGEGSLFPAGVTGPTAGAFDVGASGVGGGGGSFFHGGASAGAQHGATSVAGAFGRYGLGSAGATSIAPWFRKYMTRPFSEEQYNTLPYIRSNKGYSGPPSDFRNLLSYPDYLAAFHPAGTAGSSSGPGGAAFDFFQGGGERGKPPSLSRGVPNTQPT